MQQRKQRRGILAGLVAAICLTVAGLIFSFSVPAEAASKVRFARSLREQVKTEAEKMKAESGIYVANVNKYLSVFSENRTDSDVVGRLYRGAACYVVEKQDDWYYITSGDVKGWVCSYFLKEEEKAAALTKKINPRVATVSTVVLNVREEAARNSEIIAAVPQDTKLVITDSDQEWWKVRLTAGQEGYISRDYVTVEVGYCTGTTISRELELQKSLDEQYELALARYREAHGLETAETAEETYAETVSESEETEQETPEVKEEETPAETEEETEAETEEETEEPSGWVLLGTFKTTAYCPCSGCNGSNAGKTASGAKPTVGTTIAVDRSVIPLGSRIRIGDHEYIAQDTGVRGETIDIFHASHGEAMDYGVRYREVYIYKD